MAVALLIALASCGGPSESAGEAATPAPAPKPAQEWRWPADYSTAANGVGITGLGMLMKATGADDKERESKSATSLDYIVAFVAIAGSAGSGPIAPDLDTLAVADSLGNVYPATYTDLLVVEGMSIGAVRFRGGATGRKTYSLSVARVLVGDSVAKAAVRGPWKIDLIEQVTDGLSPGRFTSVTNRELPLEVGGIRVDWYLRSSGATGEYATFEVEDASGAAVAVSIRVVPPDGSVHVLGGLE